MTRKIIILLAFATVFSAARAQQTEPSIRFEPPKLKRSDRFDRGLAFDTKTPVIPKGMWVVGLTGSYSQHDNNDYSLLIIKNFNSQGHTLNVGPMLHYVFANNQSIGVRFQYKRMWQNLESVHLDLGDLTDSDSGTIGPYRYMSHDYMGFLSYRYYVTFGTGKRFVFFNEVQAGIGGGQQKELSGTSDTGGFLTGTYQKSLSLKLGLVPGATVFVTNAVAIEVSIGLLGYEWRKLSQTGTEKSENAGRTASSVSTKFDFLSIAFGMTFYL